MKFLILFLVLSISIQPLQAGVCDMDMDMEKDQKSAHHVQDYDAAEHDCCDSDDTETQPDCGAMLHCGSCNATFSTLPNIYRFNSHWVSQYSPALSSDSVFPSHSTPLFRPPIA